MKALFTDRNVKRAVILAVFLALLYTFRHLAPLLVFFVVFERLLNLGAGYLSSWTRLKFKWCVLLVLLGALTAVGSIVGLGIARFMHHLPTLHASTETVIQTIEHSAVYQRFGHGLSERLIEQGRHNARDVLGIAATAGREALYMIIGLIFSVVFLLERDELEHWREGLAADSAPRILLRYFGHVTDAIAITLKLQVVVAIVNALVTLPVLIALGLPGIPALAGLLLVTGLIPVVGGPIAGGVLMTLAYVTRGPFGLGVFLVSTFFLHKVESYYLTPRLTARHVKLPGFVLITSLVLFEHAFGLAGLFLSFPTLYVASRIREGWRDPAIELAEDEEVSRTMRGALPRLRGFRVRKELLTALATGEPEAPVDIAPPAPIEPAPPALESSPPS